MISPRVLLTAGLIVSLGGCATTKGAEPTLFARQTASAQQHVIDDEDCWTKARSGSLLTQAAAAPLPGLGLGASLAVGIVGGVTAGMLEPKRRLDAHDRCMVARGYGRRAVTAEQRAAYARLTTLDERAAWLAANDVASAAAPAPATTASGAPVRTVTRF